jgi:hypothetical protein
MTHTIDTLMALADKYAQTYYGTCVPDSKNLHRFYLHAALTEALAKGTQIVRTLEPIDTYLEPVQQVGENVHIVGCVNHDCALCKALAAQPVQEQIETLKRARDTAMEQSAKARIPECGHFAAIAQDLDWLVSNVDQIDTSHERVQKSSENVHIAQPVREPQNASQDFCNFHRWANSCGYDTAHTCNSDTGEWIVFNPMTKDLWMCWKAANGIGGGK